MGRLKPSDFKSESYYKRTDPDLFEHIMGLIDISNHNQAQYAMAVLFDQIHSLRHEVSRLKELNAGLFSQKLKLEDQIKNDMIFKPELEEYGYRNSKKL